MSRSRTVWLVLLTLFCMVAMAAPALAQSKPNILFIMGDDIGWMQPSCLPPRPDGRRDAQHRPHRARGRASSCTTTPSQSCTAGRNAFFTGMHPLRTGMIPPQLPGSPIRTCGRARRALAQVPARPRLQHRRVRQEPPRRSHRCAADGARLPGVLGLPVSPGRDAAGVSFPDINKTPDRAGHRAAHARTRRFPASRRSRAPIDPKDGVCMTPPRPVLSMQVLRRHGEEPDVQG